MPYYDEIEVSNPLGTKTVKHKIGNIVTFHQISFHHFLSSALNHKPHQPSYQLYCKLRTLYPELKVDALSLWFDYHPESPLEPHAIYEKQ